MTVIPRRNKKQRLCKILKCQTRCIKINGKFAIGEKTLFMNSFVFVSVSKMNNKCTIENTPVLDLDVSFIV